MVQHYFIGIKVPSTFENLMEEYKEKYHLSEAYKVIPHVEDLHVTLLYLGAMTMESIPLLNRTLPKIAVKHSSFDMQVNGISYFGSPSGPRVVYLSVEKSSVLSALQKEINHFVAEQFDKPVSDQFTPHITIAKKRKTTDELFIQKERWKPIEVPVHSFSLFTVHPEKSPKYEAIETFELVPGNETFQI